MRSGAHISQVHGECGLPVQAKQNWLPHAHVGSQYGSPSTCPDVDSVNTGFEAVIRGRSCSLRTEHLCSLLVVHASCSIRI